MSTTCPSPRPVGSFTSTVVSWVMVKTKTRSKNSSRVETRRTSSSGGVPDARVKPASAARLLGLLALGFGVVVLGIGVGVGVALRFGIGVALGLGVVVVVVGVLVGIGVALV